MACGTESAASPALPLNAWETLARAVCGSDEARQSRKDNIPASVFMRAGSPKLSTDRINQMTDDEVEEQGKYIAMTRGVNRTFYGWAEISVPNVQNANLTAMESPLPSHKWHADILFPEEDVEDPTEHTQLAGALARRAEWKERST